MTDTNEKVGGLERGEAPSKEIQKVLDDYAKSFYMDKKATWELYMDDMLVSLKEDDIQELATLAFQRGRESRDAEILMQINKEKGMLILGREVVMVFFDKAVWQKLAAGREGGKK